ncbi:MAG: hypothetical protein IM638_11240 [Bacteroidetes bacterium]|nr:hypothetical protein [Bacteroidota bacterium]
MLTLTNLSLQSYFHNSPSPQEHELYFVQHYQGPVNQGVVESLLQLIEESAEVQLLPLGLRKRLFLVVIEGLQNAVKYGLRNNKHPLAAYKLELHKNGEARVCFANYVNTANAGALCEHVKQLKAKSPEGLKQLYILRSREKVTSRDSKPSAGLGLIEIVRCAAAIRCHFLPAQYAQWFEMEVVLR